MSPFPYIQVSGTAYHMGAEYGRQCQPQINCFLEMLMAGRDRGQTLRRTRVFAPHFDHHVPQFVEQVRGLADGAGISFEEALLIQIRGEIDQGGSGPACTVFAVGPGVTASGQVLIGQNADLTDQFERIGVVLHLIPKSGPQILMWTFGGLLGYHGMNSQGVAQFANALGGTTMCGMLAFAVAYSVRFNTDLIASPKGLPPFSQYLVLLPFIGLLVPLLHPLLLQLTY